MLAKVLRRPDYALTALRRQIVARPLPAPEARAFIADRLGALDDAFCGLSGTVRGRAFHKGSVTSPHAEALWRLILDHKPRKVVETGVCNGLSTAVMLDALARTAGELVSIDLPEFTDATGSADQWEGKGGAVIPAGKSVGWLVTRPERWTLRLGRSQDLLPAEMPCDMFVHDGEHSYECQLFEFETAWAGLRPGGVLVATDINASGAFDAFRRGITGKVRYMDHTCAIVTKGAAA